MYYLGLIILFLYVLSSCSNSAIMFGGVNTCGGNDEVSRTNGETAEVVESYERVKNCKLITKFRCGLASNTQKTPYKELRQESERLSGNVLHLEDVYIEEFPFKKSKWKYNARYKGHVYSCQN